MSFAEFLRGPSPASGGAKKAQRRQHKYEKQSVEKNIELGGRAAAFLQSIWGEERAELIFAQRANGSQPSAAGDQGACLPYGFWPRFLTEDLGTQFTNRKKMQMLRALKFFVVRKRLGASTPTAMRGTRAPNSCRGRGGALNSRMAAGLGFTLLQWFVDELQELRSRSDSSLLMNKARDLRAALVTDGFPEMELPMMEGNAGYKWFERWRKSYGIVKKVTGMKLKVPWRKVKRRVCTCFLGQFVPPASFLGNMSP